MTDIIIGRLRYQLMRIWFIGSSVTHNFKMLCGIFSLESYLKNAARLFAKYWLIWKTAYWSYPNWVGRVFITNIILDAIGIIFVDTQTLCYFQFSHWFNHIKTKVGTFCIYQPAKPAPFYQRYFWIVHYITQ